MFEMVKTLKSLTERQKSYYSLVVNGAALCLLDA